MQYFFTPRELKGMEGTDGTNGMKDGLKGMEGADGTNGMEDGFEGDGRDRWDEGWKFILCPLCPFRVSLPTRASTLQGEFFDFVVGVSRACFLSFRKPKTLPRRVDALVSQERNQIPAFTRKRASLLFQPIYGLNIDSRG